MKRNVISLMILAALSIFSVSSALAQAGALATVKGVCKDDKGVPIVDAQVTWHNQDNGRNYKLKTNKKGEYFSLGIEPGKYTITLSKDGKDLFTEKDHPISVDEITFDIDIKAQQEQAVQDTAKSHGMTADQVRQMQEEKKKVDDYNANINQVNGKLKEAHVALQSQPPNYDAAINSLTQASQMVPNEPQVWCQLGSVYLDSVNAQSDPAEKTKRYGEAYTDLQKAIDLDKQKNEPAAGAADAAGANGAAGGNGAAAANGTPAANGAAKGAASTPTGKKPEDAAAENVHRAGCYNNFGSAALHSGKMDDAANAFRKAAELDPTHAAGYYYNLGVVLHNSAKDADGKKQAAEAFDKAIAADPNKADAYYLKGTDLISMATADSSGKLSAPDGTAEAFQKYLQLQPNGPHAEEAKQMLAALNQTVESTYGNKKTSTKKK